MKIRMKVYFSRQDKWHNVIAITFNNGVITGVKIEGDREAWYPTLNDKNENIQLIVEN